MRKMLLIRFDVSGFTDTEIDHLIGEATVQGEASDDHPEAPVCTISRAHDDGEWTVDAGRILRRGGVPIAILGTCQALARAEHHQPLSHADVDDLAHRIMRLLNSERVP